MHDSVARKLSLRIYKNPHLNCKYCLQPSQKMGFFSCRNPYAIWFSKVKKSNDSLLTCPGSKYKECTFYKRMKKFKKDLDYVYAYIEKFEVSDGWAVFKFKHYDKFVNKLNRQDWNYLVALFAYYGYLIYKSDGVEDGVLFCSVYDELKEQYLFKR